MTSPRPEVVALLTTIDPDTFITGDYLRHDGTPLTTAEVELVRDASYHEVGAARDVLQRRLDLRPVGGGDDAA